MRVSVTESIDAPLEAVFRFVSSAAAMAEAFPDKVIRIEVLSEHERGVGARFREFRRLGGREDVVEIETTEYVENERVLSVADKAGSLWYTGFAVEPEAGGTLLTVTMEAQPKNLLARLANVFMKPWLAKGAAKEVGEIQAHFAQAEVAA